MMQTILNSLNRKYCNIFFWVKSNSNETALEINLYKSTLKSSKNEEYLLTYSSFKFSKFTHVYHWQIPVFELCQVDLEVWCPETLVTLPDAPSILGNLAGLSV